MPACSDMVVALVDDDASFRSGLAALLRDDGHEVREFADPREVAHREIDAFDFLATDYHMADVDGLTFADRVHQRVPELPVMLITAYWTAEVEAAVAARPFLHLCRKPVDYDHLHARIHALIGA